MTSRYLLRRPLAYSFYVWQRHPYFGPSGLNTNQKKKYHNGVHIGTKIDLGELIMNSDPIRVASLGLGWWSDVLADGIVKANGIKIVSCFTRSKEKRQAFAKKYYCSHADSYEQLLADDTIDAITFENLI